MYTACLSPIDVSNAVYVDESSTSLLPGDLLVMAYLNQWISEASEECKFFLLLFLIVDAYNLCLLYLYSFETIFTTYPSNKSVRVDFLDEDGHGAITAHTFSKVISFHRGVFGDDAFEFFKSALESVF